MILVLSTRAREVDVGLLSERLGETLLIVNAKGELIRVVSDDESAPDTTVFNSGVVLTGATSKGLSRTEGRRLRGHLDRRVRHVLDRYRNRESPVRERAQSLRADRPGGKDDDRLQRLVDLVDRWSPRAVIVADEGAERIGLRLSRARPELLALQGLTTSLACLEALASVEHGAAPSALRSLLDPDGTQRPVTHDLAVGVGPRMTRVVSLVGNAIQGDSRVQKVAASLASFGFDSVLLGWHTEPAEMWLAGGATVRVLSSQRHAYEWERESPPRAWHFPLAYRSRNEMLAAQTRARAKSRAASAQVAVIDGLTRGLSGYGRLRRWDAANRWLVATRANGHQGNRREFFALIYGESERLPGPRVFGRWLPQILRHHEWALGWDLEDTFGPELERLRPSIIHAHDAEMLPVAVHAARRLRSVGHKVQVVYDAHEYIPGTVRSHSRQRLVLSEVEREYAPECEAVVTVSNEIADLLSRELELRSRPVVVENAPDIRQRVHGDDVRAALGLDSSVPLMVYVGGVAPQRGVDLAVEALNELPGVHLVLVAPESSHTRALEKQARVASTRDRLHRLDYVPAAAVVDFLRTADVGIIPFRASRNSEVGIPTKFREYLHAGLPIVCSDAQLSAHAVRSTGIGEVFKVDDPTDLAQCVSRVLAKASEYRARITPELLEKHAWERQEQRLAELYCRLTGNKSLSRAARKDRQGILIGPRNVAGQSFGWAGALRERGFEALSYQILKPEHPFRFVSDVTLTTERLQDLEVEIATLSRFVGRRAHLLMDIGSQALWPVDPQRHGISQMVRSGIRVGLVGHGSEIRRPLRHAEREKWSPYRDRANSDFTEQRRRATASIHASLSEFDGPTFVTTPDLLDDIPWATWLPVVVDVSTFSPSRNLTHEAGRPVVLHVPSRGLLKGSQYVDPILQQLHDEGVIRYLRAEGVAHARMPALIRSVDIVVDQVLMNLMGVAAAEAMASGRVVVAHVDEKLASRYPMPPPVVDATPDTLEQVVRELAADGDRRAILGRLGREFAETVHDGRLAAQVLIEGLALDLPHPLR